MLSILSDNDIETLIREPKLLPSALSPKPKMLERDGHRQKTFQVVSASSTGNEFVLALRQSTMNTTDFSAILGYKVPGSTTIFRLRRYNGKHIHTNSIERVRLNDFHIHTATERYQKLGGKEESFAQVTDRYSDLDAAIKCLLQDCGFELPSPSDQYELDLKPDTA